MWAAYLADQKLLEEFQERKRRGETPGPIPHHFGLYKPAFLILGLAMENLLKALLLKQKKVTFSGDHPKWPGNGHNQRELAKPLGRLLNVEQENILGHLEEFVVWAGRYPIREEKIREAVTAELCLLAITPSDADWMIEQVEAERAENNHARQDCVRSIRSQVLAVDEKLARLTEAMLATVISVDEYRDLKSKLVNEKQEFKDKITALEGRRGSWFEPLLRFISAAKQAGILGERGSDEEKRDFLRKVGSNLTIADCHLSVVLRRRAVSW